MKLSFILSFASSWHLIQAFQVSIPHNLSPHIAHVHLRATEPMASTHETQENVEADATTAAETTEIPSISPKEAVKLFGRLAEKYIMLDSSGGMCCYSACSGKWL